MITKKTFPTFALIAILMFSLAPSSAFALTGEEEDALSQFNSYNPNARSSPGLAAPGADVPGHVGLELQLLVDISASVDDTEFDLQRDGYEAAFQSQVIKDAITFGCPEPNPTIPRNIAVQMIYWSNFEQQSIAVDWSVLASDADSDAFAALIAAADRPFPGKRTAIGSAINFGVPLFASNGIDGDRQVIDISGDGKTNDGDDTATARDDALAGGIEAINGIIISPADTPGLADFYTDNVIGGDNIPLAVAVDFTDFEPEIEDKILLELCPEKDVGGEFLSINTASLMIAGLSANALWILPALAGIAGVGIFVIRSRMNKD